MFLEFGKDAGLQEDRTVKNLFVVVACVLICGAPAFADSITVGGSGDPLNGDCAPFGCVLEYQQVYGAGQFSSAITIGALTFFNNNFVPGSIASANYTISLSTTTAAVNGLNGTFADNLGGDNQVFFSGALGGPIGPANQFTITGTSFVYDPSNGNLLLTVSKDGGEFDFGLFLDFTSNAPEGMFSRAYGFGNSGIADFVENDTGIVTQFSSPVVTAVPEPASLWLLVAGMSAIFLLRRPVSLQTFHNLKRRNY
jgi:hypothetical protein